MKQKRKNKIPRKQHKGFTLLEVLIVIGIIAILSSIALVAINPGRQFKLARDAQRLSNVSAIVNAISQNMSEHQGKFLCEGILVALPSTATPIKSSDGFDLAHCVVPDYIPSIPFDPGVAGAHYQDSANYDSSYVIYQDAHGRIVASSTGEVTPSISSIR